MYACGVPIDRDNLIEANIYEGMERSESRHDSLFARASARVSRRVCTRVSWREGERNTYPPPPPPPPLHRQGADGAPRRQMLAQTRLHATKACMPAHAPPSFTKSFLPITALAYTRFHADCGPPMHLLPRPSRPSHALASMPVTSGCCPSIHSLSRPSWSSNTQACAPVALLA